ncbi:MAG: exopolyphosphatase [Schleiferiaceae bacterium]|nr:exopolyphosphatase [Schleiferiaceae bacterium]
MKIVKLGAIDIGSNSVRLLITNVIPTEGHTYYQKVSMIRLPIRLGSDSFTKGKISKKNVKRMTEGLSAYKSLMNVHGVEDYRACATSAMREAENGQDLVKHILKKTGIEIEVIDGKEEAKLIFTSKLFDKIHPDEKNFVFVDVGGGSTEFTVFINGEIVASKSFKVGTVRLLNGIVEENLWEDMRLWIDENTKGIDKIAMIGSGGNINKTHKISGLPQDHPLTLKYLESFMKHMKGMSRESMVTEMGLNLDRADVIVPALEIYIMATKAAGATKMYVPKIGVSDGITRDLYHRKYKAAIEI